MPDYSDLEKLYDTVELARAKKAAKTGDMDSGVTDEEKQECRRWADGQDLQHLITMPGYEVIVNILKGFMEQDVQICMATKPGDNDSVLANQAVAYSSTQNFFRFMQEVASCVEAAKKTPDIVKEGIRLTRGIPPESA